MLIVTGMAFTATLRDSCMVVRAFADPSFNHQELPSSRIHTVVASALSKEYFAFVTVTSNFELFGPIA